MPGTSQRPENARQPTKTSRSTMKVLRPDQMPSRPQPNTSDSQISGRKPTQRADQGGVAHELRVTGAEQHAVERENDSGDRQLGHHEPPRHPDRVEHRAVVGEHAREHRRADGEDAGQHRGRRAAEKIVTRHATDLACAS